ncbi:Zinc finger protein 998 [Apodemus speciosus]|uniref:Zinc finger protein 998 n=1 Tax=Apodemus speciosus TaxID=105296 RepID=A0ABQ0FWF4_APOSI
MYAVCELVPALQAQASCSGKVCSQAECRPLYNTDKDGGLLARPSCGNRRRTCPPWIMGTDTVTFDDVHMNFTEEEWNLLVPSQKSLYKDVMLEAYLNLKAIGYNWEDHHLKEHCKSGRRHERHVRSHSGENPMNAIIVLKPLQNPVISNIIKQHILERNHIDVINVIKPL